MDKTAIKQRIEELRKVLEESNRRYYVDNSPEISDYEFDLLMHELEKLEKENPEFTSQDSPTAKVGSDIAARSGFIQRPHRYPMLSLSNTYSISEIEEFAARAEKTLDGAGFSYSCELKFDGTAISLSYSKGRLVRALTRGDGVKGDDITENAKSISNIPQQLKGDYPEEFEIRGEVMMPYAAFDALNKEREAQEESPFANPRNAASGSLKLLDPAEVAHRGLYCTLYHIPAESADFASHSEALDAAASWGLPVSDERRVCHSIEEVREYIEYWDKQRKFLAFATDGIVIKINEMDMQRSLGYTAKSPRWAVAYKFKAEQACTRLESISYQVGRTGAITPVANLSPVQLSGTVVKRATLNNAEQMRELDVRIGDYVFVEKGGEIIPKITGVDLEQRRSDSPLPEFPEFCPDCGTPLVKQDGEAKHFCPNEDSCPMQIKGRLLHFVSRRAMDILAGEMSIEQFYEGALARTASDLYRISKIQLVGMEGWQDRSAQKFLDSLEASKSVPFERVLYALGIRFIGEATAKSLARHFGDIDRLAAASLEDLVAVEDIGAVTADSVYRFLHDEAHLAEIARLKEAGLQFSSTVSSDKLSESLAGKTIVISGNFSISRDAMKELIASHGGKASSSISKKTAFLVAGSKAGPEKLKKCEELGVLVLSEEAFMAMLPPVETKKNEIIIEEPTLF